MIENFQGKMWFLAFILLFLGWCLVSIHEEEKMRAQLEQKQTELEQAKTERAAAIQSFENALRAKEQVHAEITSKQNYLEITLDAVSDWSDIDIPDDVARLLQQYSGQAGDICTSGNAPGRCEDTLKIGDQDCGRYGAPDSGR